jgi:hypothetical protein
MIDRIKFDDTFQYYETEVKIEVIEIYLSEYQERFTTIRNNIVQKDFRNLAYSTCVQKGVVSYFCDPLVIKLSRQLFDMARNNVEDGLEKLFEELEISNGLMAEELKAIKVELIREKNVS